MDNFEDIDTQVLAQRAVSGAASLVSRKILLRGFSYITTVILARILTPEIFGVFAIVSFILTFFSFFSDIGLGAALIQKKESVTQKDLSTAFFVQQILVIVITVLIFIAAAPIASRYHLAGSGAWLIRATSLSLILTSLKTIPSILLERVLRYNRLIIVEVVEVFSFQILVIILALAGFGVWSFIIALVVRSFLGLSVLTVLSPWIPSLALDWGVAKKLISFGLPYQTNYFLALIKDSLTPVFVGLVAGAAAVGYLNWAFTFSKIPIEFMSDFFRITFPAYSRIQNDRQLIKKSVEKTLFVTNAIIFPGVFLLLASASQVVHIVFTDKWLPALPAFYIHSFGVLLVGINNTFTNTFWALGKVKLASAVMIVSTIANWSLSVPLVLKFGFVGAVMGSVGVLVISLPLSIYLMNRIVPVNILGNSFQPLVASALSGAVVFYLSRFATNLVFLILILLCGGLLYILFLYLFGPNKVKVEALWIWGKIKKK